MLSVESRPEIHATLTSAHDEVVPFLAEVHTTSFLIIVLVELRRQLAMDMATCVWI